MSSVFPEGLDNLGLEIYDDDVAGDSDPVAHEIGLHASMHREERSAINALEEFLLREHGTNFSNDDGSPIAPVSSAITAINGQYFLGVRVLGRTVLTGIRYKKGSGTGAVNVRSALYDRLGQRISNRTTNLAASTTASAGIDVPFDASVIVDPGLYWASLIFSAAATNHILAWAINTATVWNYLHPYHYAAQASFLTALSFTPPPDTAIQTLSIVPWVTTY